MCIISISTISLQYWYCLYCSNNRKMSLQVGIGSSTASWPINFQNDQGFLRKILSHSIQPKRISIFISKVFWKTSNANYLAERTRNIDFIYNWRAISENLIFILNYSWRLLVYQKALPHIIINTDFLKVSDILVFNWNIKCQLELVCVHYDLSVESAWNKNTPFKPHFAWKINTWRKYDIIWNSFGCDIFRLYFIWDIFILHFILFRVICKIHVATIKRNIQSFVRRFLSFLELHFVWKMNDDGRHLWTITRIWY